MGNIQSTYSNNALLNKQSLKQLTCLNIPVRFQNINETYFIFYPSYQKWYEKPFNSLFVTRVYFALTIMVWDKP